MNLQSGSGGLFLDLGHLGRFENYNENEIVNRIEYHSILYVFLEKYHQSMRFQMHKISV